MKKWIPFLSLLLFSCSPSSSIYYLQGEGVQKLDLAKSLREAPTMEKGEIEVKNLGGNEHQSTHLVFIKTHEAPHMHAEHDLTVRLLKGEGTLQVGKDSIVIKVGDLVSVPRKTVHAFTNQSKEPAAAYVVFTPSFDGKDVVPVKSPSDTSP